MGQMWYNRQLGMHPSPSPIDAERVTLFVILNSLAFCSDVQYMCVSFVFVFKTYKDKTILKNIKISLCSANSYAENAETLCMYFKPGKTSVTGLRIS